MCKPWPGLRCSDHGSQKIRKYSAQLHELENQLSELDESMQKLAVEHGDGFDGSPEHDTLMKRRNALLEKVRLTEERKDTQICDYAMSAGGRKKLKEVIENSESPGDARLNAATELAAAQNRIGFQKELGKVLNDPDLAPEEKDAFLGMQEEIQERKLLALKGEKGRLERSLRISKRALKRAQDAGSEFRIKKYSGIRNQQLTRHQMIVKEIAQRKALKQEIKAYREKYHKQFQAKYKKITSQIFKVMDFLIQPNKKPSW